jgi:hypothetical protein
LADREQPTSGRRLRALRGREEIARLTARLRSEHAEYESASQSWSSEAGEKKKELRKARADTLVEIGAALTWLGEVERGREIERLPFEQKLELLEAFLEEGNTPPDVIPHAVAEPSIALPEPAATQEAPRAPSEPPPPAPLSPLASPALPAPLAPPASLRPRSMRPPTRRSMGYWPVRHVPSRMPRASRWRVPLLVGVIAIQGLGLFLLSLAVWRISSRYSESDPSRATTSNATAPATAAIAATPLPPPAPQPAASSIPSALLVTVPAAEPRPAAPVRTSPRAAPPPRPPARLKPATAPSLPVLARQPEVFVPDTL